MKKSRLFLLAMEAVVLFGLTLNGCGSSNDSNPCEGWTCSYHGECKVTEGKAACECDPFYEASEDGTQCLSSVNDPCAPYTCSGHGRCHVDAEDKPYCECDNGWAQSGDKLDCIENDCQDDCGMMGCCGTSCCKAAPSNSDIIGTIEDNGLSKNASGSFDTDNDCVSGSALGDCQLVPVTGGVDICTCRLSSLTIGSSLHITGTAALAILAWDTITINGSVDISATGSTSGPGAITQQDEEASNWRGGKGGSNGTAGGNAGDEPRPPKLTPLEGGQAGQDGCGGRKGGGGGGALQLVAGTSINISGSIHAGGGGGAGGQYDPDDQCIGGAGGGSGGSLLVEAPNVSYSGTYYANGGSGGGGGNNTGQEGEAGKDALSSSDPVQGGQGRDGASCALYGAIEGGDGGAGSSGDSQGGDGQDYDSNQCPDLFPYVGGGGGGGGAGRLRINTRADCQCTGLFSPSPSNGYLKGL